MASAWGNSWGSYWGNAWGVISQAVTGGGIGHGGKKKKPVYIERDGQVILFKSNAHAAAYLSAEKVIKQAQRLSDLPKTVKLKLKKAEERIKSAEVIDLNALLSAFQQEEQQRLINEAWAKKAYDELVSFQLHLALEQYLEREEDEEIEAILLLM